MVDNDIIINGISLLELKKQRASIRQGSTQVISENIEIAKALTKKLVDSKDKEEIESLANKAYEALKKASFVSEVSGVTFSLPFNEDYEDRETFSSLLESSDNEVIVENWDGVVSDLYSLFENMEGQSYEWHSSRC